MIQSEKKLIPLEEHNAKARSIQSINYNYFPVKNGIACPNCGTELWDSNPMITLTSYPAQKDVHCTECHYKGYRIA